LKKKGSESGLDSNSAGSDYLSFQGSDCDEGNEKGEEEEERVVAGEREQRMILEDAGLILRDDARVKEMGCGSGKVREVLEKTIGPGDDDEDGKEKKKEEKRRRRERRPPPAVPVGPRALSLTRGQAAVSDSTAIDPSDESSIVDSDSTVSTMPQQRRRLKRMVSNTISAKDLPPIPSHDDDDDDANRRLSKLSTSSSWSLSSSPPALTSISKRNFDPDEHAKRLDDAFERYESFKKAHLAANYNNNNRLSVVSATSTDSSLVYPPLSPTMMGANVMTPASSKEFETGSLPHQQHLHPHRHHRFSANLSSLPYGLHSHISQGKSEESPTGVSPGGSRYSQLLQFLSIGRAKTPEHESGAGRKVTISGPIVLNSMSGEGDGSLDGGTDSPAFGSVSSEVLFVENCVSDRFGGSLGRV